MKSKINEKENNAVLILAAGYKAYDNSFISYEPFLNIGNTLIIERIKKSCSATNKIYIAVNNFSNKLQGLRSFENCNFINLQYGDIKKEISNYNKKFNKNLQ